MAEIIARAASTGVFRQGGVYVRITKEALESMNESPDGKAVPVTIGHDPYSLPIGKIQETWIEPDGEEYVLMVRIHIEDGYSRRIHRRSGIELVVLEFGDSQRPFTLVNYDTPYVGQDSLTVDLANFDSIKNYEAFANDVNAIDSTLVCDNKIVRQALVPDPFLQFVLSNPELTVALSVGVWIVARLEKFVRYTVDETLKKVADEIATAASDKIRKIMRSYQERRSQDGRAVVSQVVIPGTPTVVLLTKTELGEEHPNLNLESVVAELERFGDLLKDADSVTLAQAESDDWRLQHIRTKSGQVVASHECHEYTMASLSQLTSDQGSEDQDETPETPT